MSDAGTDDDGGFDKEAEREKLRKKYEEDQQKRESTQRMSELLLQGATMTNEHCDRCGNPRFRYEGDTFCPSCQGEDGDTETQTAPQGADEGESEASEAGAEAASPGARGESQPRTAESETERTPEPERAEPTAEQPTRRTQERTGGRTAERTETTRNTPEPAGEPNRPDVGRNGAGATNDAGARRERADDTSLDAARDSVRATLNDLAARAERSNDAAHTKELLAATREAAQTLKELNRLE